MFFTELQGLRVYDVKGRKIGRIRDAAVVPLIDPIRVDRYLIGGGWAWLTIRHDQVKSISLDGIYLRDENLTPYHRDEYMLRLGRDLLDQQIIDVHGSKVVRVTDITFTINKTETNDELRLMEVDIGLRSMFRRLVQGVLPYQTTRRLMMSMPLNSIRWDYCNIVEADPQRRLRLNISHAMLEKMHPADLADIVEELSADDREAIFETIDSEVAAETLSEIEPEIQTRILESLDADKAADIVGEMSPHEAADLLGELEESTSEEILEEMESEDKSDVQELLEFEDDTAGGMMNTEYITLHENANVADAIEAMKGNEELLENLNTLFLVDLDEKYVASVPLARLFAAAGSAQLRELRSEPTLSVTVDEKQDEVIELFDKYNLLTLPVVDDEGKLSGVITVDDIITILRQQ